MARYTGPRVRISRRPLNEIRGFGSIREQRLDLAKQCGITFAGIGEERGALVALPFQGCVIEPLDVPPSLGRHLRLVQLSQ